MEAEEHFNPEVTQLMSLSSHHFFSTQMLQPVPEDAAESEEALLFVDALPLVNRVDVDDAGCEDSLHDSLVKADRSVATSGDAPVEHTALDHQGLVKIRIYILAALLLPLEWVRRAPRPPR